MEISKFESAFKAIAGNSLPCPALAIQGTSLQIEGQMPQEFQLAARTLAERQGKCISPDSVLRAAAQWT